MKAIARIKTRRMSGSPAGRGAGTKFPERKSRRRILSEDTEDPQVRNGNDLQPIS